MAASTTTDLERFDSISICAPLNVLIVPSTTGESQISVKADQASSIRASVTGSLLTIETTGDIQAKGDIKVTVQPQALLM